MTEEQDVKNRIKEVLRFHHITENQLSKLGRLSQKVLNNQLSHGANLQVGTVLFILDQFPGLSANWIMKGEGTMYPTDTEQPTGNVEFSSIVNTIVAAKDETIEALNGKIAAKDEAIEALKSNISAKDALIEDLNKKIAAAYTNDCDGIPPSFGVAESDQTYKRK